MKENLINDVCFILDNLHNGNGKYNDEIKNIIIKKYNLNSKYTVLKELNNILLDDMYYHSLRVVTHIKEYINLNELNDDELININNEIQKMYIHYVGNTNYYVGIRLGFSYDYNLENMNYNIENIIDMINNEYEKELKNCTLLRNLVNGND